MSAATRAVDVKRNKVSVALPRYSHRNLLAYNHGVEVRMCAPGIVQFIQQIRPPAGDETYTVVSCHRSCRSRVHDGTCSVPWFWNNCWDTYTNWDMKEICPSTASPFSHLAPSHPPYSFRFPSLSLPQLLSNLSLFPLVSLVSSGSTYSRNVYANKQNGSNLRTQPDERPSLYRGETPFTRFNISSLNEISKEAPI